jgi:orotidine-5'-phosphate decarboxylase
MTRKEIVDHIYQKKSFLCVGLDTDVNKIPRFFLDFPDPAFEFNRRVIDATKDHCVAYKPNIAFYEARGVDGWQTLTSTLDYIPKTHFTIADAKRGDIGNTSRLYAKAFFETYAFDSITVAPYMGRDSVEPFLDFEGKWVILLGLTSNSGSQDFQFQENKEGKCLFETVIEVSSSWSSPEKMMYVVGATQPESFFHVRKLVPDHFLLVPGVGSQGGDLKQVFIHGANQDIGLLVNASRSIIYASKEEKNFNEAVEEAANTLHREMVQLLS